MNHALEGESTTGTTRRSLLLALGAAATLPVTPVLLAQVLSPRTPPSVPVGDIPLTSFDANALFRSELERRLRLDLSLLDEGREVWFNQLWSEATESLCKNGLDSQWVVELSRTSAPNSAHKEWTASVHAVDAAGEGDTPEEAMREALLDLPRALTRLGHQRS